LGGRDATRNYRPDGESGPRAGDELAAGNHRPQLLGFLPRFRGRTWIDVVRH
jgi:hypothetical protein